MIACYHIKTEECPHCKNVNNVKCNWKKKSESGI